MFRRAAANAQIIESQSEENPGSACFAIGDDGWQNAPGCRKIACREATGFGPRAAKIKKNENGTFRRVDHLGSLGRATSRGHSVCAGQWSWNHLISLSKVRAVNPSPRSMRWKKPGSLSACRAADALWTPVASAYAAAIVAICFRSSCSMKIDIRKFPYKCKRKFPNGWL